MAASVFNVAKGKVAEYFARVDSNDPANSAIIVVLLKASQAQATLIDYDDLATLLADAGNTEADFTNYARKTLTDADIAAPVTNDTDNRVETSIPEITWTAAGGATDNTLTVALFCYDSDTTGGTDATIIPLLVHDFAQTTGGGNLSINAAQVCRSS